MRSDKDKAFELRKMGRSYNEIHKELGMSRSTLSNWFKGHDFSEEIKIKLTQGVLETSTIRLKSLNNKRGVILSLSYEQARKEAFVELERYKKDPLFISAIIAYWGEGDKLSKNQVRITNTDPMMIILFKNFLLDVCKVEKGKMRLALFIYNDLNEDECKKYWMEQTGLEHFHKTMILPGRHKTKRLPFGTCTLVLSNTYLKQKILVWIDQLPKMVLNIVSE